MLTNLAAALFLMQAPNSAGLQQALDAWHAGHFAESQQACDQVLAADPANIDAHVLRARLLVYKNDFRHATPELDTVLRSQPQNIQALGLKIEVEYREDHFGEAADLMERAGRTPRLAQLRAFADAPPYDMGYVDAPVHVKFVNTDPLPLIGVSVNGGPEVNFLIDTGGGETILDTDYAKSIGVQSTGDFQGMYGGGKTALTGLAKIESLGLGSLTIRNIPVQLLSTKAFSAAAQGKPVSGILGTIFLYHFLPTLDYLNHELVLAPSSTSGSGKIAIPFWMASDHFIVAEGALDQGHKKLFLVDTGLAGAAFTGPKSTLDEAGVKVSLANATTGVGGGGSVQAVPFAVDSLSLGPAVQEHLQGLYGPFPDALEEGLGFHLGGLISHQFFRNYRVTFDFHAMVIYLEP